MEYIVDLGRNSCEKILLLILVAVLLTAYGKDEPNKEASVPNEVEKTGEVEEMVEDIEENTKSNEGSKIDAPMYE